MSGKLLLICPFFFKYEEEITTALGTCGKTVIRINEIPYGSAFFLFKNIYKPASNWLIQRYEQYILDIIEKNNISELFVIRGQFLQESLFKKIKKIWPSLKIWHYQWDSRINNPNAKIIADYADRSFSFDRKDCLEDSRFKYLPLFYIEKEANYVTNKSVKHTYDLIFIGSFHLFRFAQLIALKKYLKKQGIEFYFRIYIPPLVFLKYFLKGKIRNNFDYLRFWKFGKSELIDLTMSARCVLDLPSPTQTGCTMRLIESLAYNKSVFTTNQNITAETFYLPESIKIVNFEHQSFEQFSVFPIPPRDVKNKIVEINDWVRIIIGLNDSRV